MPPALRDKSAPGLDPPPSAWPLRPSAPVRGCGRPGRPTGRTAGGADGRAERLSQYRAASRRVDRADEADRPDASEAPGGGPRPRGKKILCQPASFCQRGRCILKEKRGTIPRIEEST